MRIGSGLDVGGLSRVCMATVIVLGPLIFLASTRPPREAPRSPTTFEQDLAIGQKKLHDREALQSIAPLERARRVRPDAFAVHNNLCVAYGMLERREEAIDACQRALSIDPGNQLGRRNLAWVDSLRR